MVYELNKVRSDPAKYAELVLKPELRYYNGKQLSRPGEVTIITNEGARAVEECIRVLSAARPLPLLSPSEPLTSAARDHVKDTGPRGIVGHTGSDGSTLAGRVRRYDASVRYVGENIDYGNRTARHIVAALLVDDGVANRGHRKNIMNGQFDTVGVAVGGHKTYGSMCVMDLARLGGR